MDRPPPLSVRLPVELRQALMDTATAAGLTYSDWVREIITAALRSGQPLQVLCARLAESEPTPIRQPQLPPIVRRGAGASPATRIVTTRTCLHPPHRVQHFTTFSRCQACGEHINAAPNGVVRRPLLGQAPAL